MDTQTLNGALERARLIEIRTRKAVDEQLTGGYRSVFRGRGMDFDEVREYVPGDDVRAIDWNVTARAGRAHVKRFREERELTVMLVVDLSASGDYGSGLQTKRELAAELACVLAFAALRSRDKVGLLLFSDRVENFVPPASGRGHVLRMVSDILTFEPRGRGTDIALALDHLNTAVRKRAAVLLISDLVDGPRRDEARSALVLASSARRHDLTALWLRDPCECELPDVGVVTLEDAETGEVVVLDCGRRAVRARFAELAAERRERERQRFAAAGARLVELLVGGDYLPPLVAFFTAHRGAAQAREARR